MKKVIHLIALILTISVFNAKAQEILCVDAIGASDYYISWSPPATPCGPFVNYEIWAANDPNNAFTLITTITTATQTDYTHVNGITVGSPIYYYIVFNYNCPGQPPSTSPISTSDFGSYQPEISSINVTNSGIEICWEESTFPQTTAYVVSYLLPNGLAQPIDTVYGITNTCYTDIVSNPNDENLQYTLIYMNGCGSFSQYNEIGYQLLHATADQQGCNQLIEYEWGQYTNPYNLGYYYQILVNINGSADTLVSTQAGNQNIYNLFDFLDGDTIAMRVEVIDSNGVPRSNSPWRYDTAQIVQPPTEFYIYHLSVVNDTQIDISFFIDNNAELRNMQIDTSKYGSDFDWVERYDRSVFAGLGNIYLPDTTSPPYANNWRYYRITANDSCNTNHYSTIGRTIFAEAKLNDFFKNEVLWNPFELEDATVNTYRLYRDYGAGMQYVESFSPSTTDFSYIDDISAYYDQLGNFCYKVEAEYTFEYPDGSTENFVSSSNVSCVEERPTIYIPNAIVPSGTNNEFKPYIVFGNPTNYKMQIFNRWGALIFESHDVNTGWQGTNNGSLVPLGGYPYIIEFTASDGQKIKKKGIVSVIR